MRKGVIWEIVPFNNPDDLLCLISVRHPFRLTFPNQMLCSIREIRSEGEQVSVLVKFNNSIDRDHALRIINRSGSPGIDETEDALTG